MTTFTAPLTMLALQWIAHSLHLNQVKCPSPQANEALIKVNLAGICNTDLEIIKGYYPFQGTLGHEFVGTIVQAQDSNLIGQRVVSDINFSCHACSMCQAGHPHHCLHRKTLGIHASDGAFAEYLCAPISNLTFVPDELPDEAAVFAEPLAAALEILEQYNFSNIKEASVIGDGKLGLLIAMCLSSQGIAISLIGHHPEKFRRLNDSQIQFFTSLPKQKFPLVIEATGNPAGFNDALAITQAKGCLVLKSTYAKSFAFNPAVLVVNEITLLGSRCGPMDKAIDLMNKSLISPECLIDESFSLKDGLQAVENANQKGRLKVLIKP